MLIVTIVTYPWLVYKAVRICDELVGLCISDEFVSLFICEVGGGGGEERSVVVVVNDGRGSTQAWMVVTFLRFEFICRFACC